MRFIPFLLLVYNGFILLNAGGFFDLPKDDVTQYGGKAPGVYRWIYPAEEKRIYYFDGIFSIDGCDVSDSRKKYNLTVNVQ